MANLDAVIVGSGPNGLAAAVVLARAGLAVRVYEQATNPGGGSRTAETTLPGFHHDVCSAVHPTALVSTFFRRFGLTERVPFVVPELSYAQPLDGGSAAFAWRDLDRTAEGLGPDGRAWSKFFRPLVEHADDLAQISGTPVVRIPRHPVLAARLGLRALEQGSAAWSLRFQGERAPALLTGVMAHTISPLPSLGAAAAGIVLAAHGHALGWALPVGGSQAIVDALVDDFLGHGGEIRTDCLITRLEDLPRARAVLLDTSTRTLLRLGGDRLPAAYRRALERFRFGNGAAKVDFALSGPVPWRPEELGRAGTLHLGGTREQMRAAEQEVAAGRHSEAPVVLVAQPSAFDSTRAPDGGQTLWTYAHVPRGSDVDQTEAVTRQIERFAPGFRELILATSSTTAADMEEHNPNYVGGDIASGAASFAQLVARPVLSPTPWRTPVKGLYLCSSAASPGPGVHGLGGWYAARLALRERFGITEAPSLAPTEGRSG